MALSKPIFFKTATVTLTPPATTPVATVQCQVHALAFVPDVPDLERYVTLCGSGSYSASGTPTWSVEMTIAQAWAAEDIARIMFDHAGEEWTLRAQVHGEGIAPTVTQPAMEAKVMLVPGPYGGEAETWLESELVLPCTTKPVLVTSGTLMAAEAELEQVA